MRRVAWLLLAVLVAGATAATHRPGTSAAQSATDGHEAFADLAACIGDSKQLLVVFLFDESASLQSSDPTGRRVTAAKVALSGLEALTRSANVHIEVQLAGFAADYTPVGGWIGLNPSTLAALETSVGTFARRDRGIDTDYFAALRGAHRQLAERDAALAGQAEAPCKAILWFTDGIYNINDRLTDAQKRYGLTKDYAPGIRLDRTGGGQAALAEGRRQLCESNPLVDELRQADATLIAIALSTGIAPGDLAPLRAITNGTADGATCGRLGSPSTGATLDASEIDALIDAFDQAANLIAGGLVDPGQTATPICPGHPCPEGRRTFDLDDTLRRFHLLAATGREGIQVLLEGPGRPGSPIPLQRNGPASGAIGDVTIRWAWVTPTSVTVDAALPDSGQDWEGTWTVTFVDPAGQAGAVARSQIYLFGDLVPKLIGPARLEAGEPNQIHVGVVSKLDETKLRRITAGDLQVTATDPSSGLATPLAPSRLESDGTFSVIYEPPAHIEASEVDISLRLTVRTKRGLALAPETRTQRLPVRIAGLPTVRLERDRLPAIAGTAATTATVIVSADPASAGCVWLAGSTAKGPPSAGQFTAESTAGTTGRESCLRVEPGATDRFDVTIRAAGTANGKVAGNLRLGLMSDNRPEPVERTLSYQFPITRPIDAAKRAGVFIALLLPGILVPILIAYGANWWSARFHPVGVVSSAQIPVRVTTGGVERLDARGEPAGRLLLSADDFTTAVAPNPRRQRRFTHRGYDFRVPFPKSPFAVPHGEARHDSMLTGGSSVRGSTSRDGRAGRLGHLGLPGEWLLSTPAGPQPDPAATPHQLVVFAGSGLEPRDLAPITSTIHERAGAVAKALADRQPPAPAVPQPGPDDTWPPDGPPGGPPPPGPPAESGPTPSSTTPPGDEPPW